METYGLVIDTHGEFSISGDPLIPNSPTSFQMLRSTHCSMIWNNESSYKIYFVKYPILSKDYLTYALNSLNNNTWQQNVITSFKISYNDNIIDHNNKIITATSNDNIWKLTFNIIKNKTIGTTITLPYIIKDTVYSN